MSYANDVEVDQERDNSYLYVRSNCSDNLYQIGIIKILGTVNKEAFIQGNYSVKGNITNYQDPGPIGIYSGETDELLIRKFIGK